MSDPKFWLGSRKKRPLALVAGMWVAACGGSGEVGSEVPGAERPGAVSPGWGCEEQVFDCPPPFIETTATRPERVFQRGTVVACDRSLIGRIGETPLRRLLADEYDNTVRDLLGLPEGTSIAKQSDVPADGSAGPFPSNAVGALTEAHVAGYRRAAERVAADTIAAPDRLAALVPCAADANRACAEQFIRSFGRRAFRRPMTAERVDALLEVFDVGAEGASFADGIGLVIEAALQSPNFLYHVEDKTPSPKAAPLGTYELAERLSYFLWRTMPDEALYQAAERGELQTLEGLRTRAMEMLDDPRAAPALAKFTDYWLSIGSADREERDLSEFPEFGPDFGAAARRETERFVDYVVRDSQGGGKLETLLTANFSFPSQPLWAGYGLTPPPGYAGETPLPMPEGRAGILTQISGLLVHSSEETSPIERGMHVLQSMLCRNIERPTNGSHDEPATRLPLGDSARERITAATRSTECSPCHEKIDPIGFAFERFDRIGKKVAVDSAGNAIDDAAQLELGDPTLDGPVAGAVELAQRVWRSDSARNCMLQQVHRFALARMEVPEDTCAFVHMAEVFEASGYDVRALFLDMVTEDTFRFRPSRPQ
jgi:hypothetical protein